MKLNKKGMLVCNECGKRMHLLKRHLWLAHSMDIDDYRNKWSLDEDFPSTSEAYAAKKSEFVSRLGN